MAVRRCRGCKRTERQVYISGHYHCRRCAVEAAQVQAERAFDVARKLHGSRTDPSLNGGIKSYLAYATAMHADATKRRSAKKRP